MTPPGREGRGPERPGPDYPPEWDDEPDDDVSAPDDGPPLPGWWSYDVLLHGRCGRKLSEHPLPYAPDASCPFPELPPVEFARETLHHWSP